MSFDSVPWFVGGGAEHSVEVARLLAYAATSGAAGVVAPADLKVSALPVAGTSVRVAVGGVVIPNLYPGGGQQTYIGRAPTTTDIPVTATDSASGRTDLVIARVDDPQYGAQAPPDVTVGPYIRVAVIENVTPNTSTLPAGTAYPAIVLARITIPASTATITNAMITDLRKLANPRSIRTTFMSQPNPSTIPGTWDYLTETVYRNWPLAYVPTVEIPAWATHFNLVANMSGLGHSGGNKYGALKVALGSIESPEVNWDLPGGIAGNTREDVMAANSAPVGELAGTTQSITIKAKVIGASLEADFMIQSGTTLVYDIEFLEKI